MEINLYDILSLDSIYHLLSYDERINIRLVLQGKEENLCTKAQELGRWIVENTWIAPEMKYHPDRLLRFYHEKSEEWHLVEDYPKQNPKITIETRN